jgi:uncharacterized protein
MNILITGGTGFLGSALTQYLLARGHRLTLVSRNPARALQRFGNVTVVNNFRDIQPTAYFETIINLAGAPIFDARWTEARKKLIRDSRIGLTEQLVEWISRLEVKPLLLISGSAIGYYGDQGDRILTEQAPTKSDFSQQLCADWESAALTAQQYRLRVCIIRTGLVIDQGGGMLERMLLPFKLGLGGTMGAGTQWMSWIHRQDWLAIVQAMIDDPNMSGAYNATAPVPATNAEFTRCLGAFLHRPTCLPLPAWLLKIILGEMSELLLGSQRVLPERLLQQGYRFHYSTLEEAFSKIFQKS